ncbi:hypothetical protein PlfCFBP13513_15750 [Plantibacter flavus]|uniref:hypothetical protein n=1 Tax=Plantibacter TaxID=190323 RepID=UPI0010C1F801|nr:MULTISPECIES: hypothetical protein [Plantibacter]MBD8103954.1 hypothetical protein [Plantibacter sp. CFBP 8775]MBD8467401.1 hypothetical protein [Plantibacter sp. CFBP 8798]TKJ96861.1 hypothetical protein PlfCFBP13513_15750 [Plantibacter flavus]
METFVALYGAALATILAIAQGISFLRRRARIGVTTGLRYEGMEESERDTSHGTPVLTRRGRDVELQEVLVQMTIRNEGGVPVQVVAVVIESLTPSGDLTISQFSPEPLPHVLEPGTRIEIMMQKEPLDMLDNVTFFGVSDALGRRYASNSDDVRDVVLQSWNLPTRVAKFVRRDDISAPPVLAYQSREESALVETTRVRKGVRPLVHRAPLLDAPPPSAQH